MSSNRYLLRAAVCAFLNIAMAALALDAAQAVARERIEPPLELLYMPGNQLVAGPLVEINPDGRLVFERKDVLGGKDQPDRIDLRAPMSTLATVKLGERYVFGYSTSRRDPRDPTRISADPNGPVLLTSVGLEPALFRDTPEVRAILKTGRSERGRESKRLFDLLMQALAGPDPQLQNLAAGEIAQEPEIGERLRKNGQAVAEKVARDPRTPPGVRASLLLSASVRPLDLGDWWQAAALDVVTSTPLDGYHDEASDPSGLVLLALEVLDTHAIKVAPEALTRWVRSANSSLVEHACLMLRRESPAMERSAIREALADPNLPEPTRQFLNDHLRRLDLLDARSKKLKEGIS